MIIRRLIAPLTAAVMAVHAGQALSQGAFPAPLPGQAAAPANDPAFPPVNGTAPVTSLGAAPTSSFPVNGAAPLAGAGFQRPPAPPSQQPGGPAEQCMKAFLPLREEAEKRGKLIKAAGDRHAGPDEACKLIGSFAQAELKLINYVEAHAVKCGIPPQVPEQLKAGHKNTEMMQKRICEVAQKQQQQQKGPAGPTLSEVLGSAATLPDTATAKKSGGSTFDTLNGNVLAR